MKTYHPHPLQIVRNMQKILYLLFLPLLRGLLSLLQGDFQVWVDGAWKDILVLGFIILYSVLQWINYTFSISSEGISLRYGLLRQVKRTIPAASMCVVSCKSSWLLRPLGGVYIFCDTPAGGNKHTDMSMIVTPKAWEELAECIPVQAEEYLMKSYHPKNLYVVLLAAITSNSLTGVLLAGTLISHAGKLLGEQFSQRLYGTFQLWTKALAFGLPPAAAGVAYIVFFGWLLAFAGNFLRHQNFSVAASKNTLLVQCGWLEKKSWRIRRSQINYLDIRQTLYSKALGLYTVFIYSFGYGKERNEVSALMPAVGRRELELSLGILLPEFQKAQLTIRPGKRSMGRFLWQPLFPAAAVALTALFGAAYWTNWADLWLWLGIMGEAPFLWFALVRLIDCFTSGGGWQDNQLTLRYSKGFSFHTVVIPSDKIALMKITQSIFQKRKNTCDLFVYSYNEGEQKHRLRNVALKDARWLTAQVMKTEG